VVPADNKWVTHAVVADVLTTTIHSLKLRYPEVSDDKKKTLAVAQVELENE